MENTKYIAGLGDYKKLAEEILERNLNFIPLKVIEEPFPDGEIHHRIHTDPRKKDIILVCGTPDDRHFLHLIDVACACAKYGANSISMIIPYLGYSTMEKATMDGDVVKAKVRARMLSAIPQAKEGNTILFLDLHADGITHFLEGDTRGFHIYSQETMCQAISHAVGDPSTKFCVGSTDAGRSKWVQSLANRLGVDAVTAQKTRHSGSEVSLDDIQGKMKGKVVAIYDDMIRTGGSLLQAARGYREYGATKVVALTTHGVFPNNSLEKILEAKFNDGHLIESLACTDSIPKVHELVANLPQNLKERVTILPTFPIWLDAIRNHL